MRFNIHLRDQVREQIGQLAETMKSWEEQPRIDESEQAHIRQNLAFFPHTTEKDDLIIAGSDGTGDFPAVTYADSFVYVSVAQGTTYAASPISGLRELEPMPDPVVHFTWLPEDSTMRKAAFDEAFSYLAGMPLVDVIERSDYRSLKNVESGKLHRVDGLVDKLIRPHAADSGNVGLQLRSTAELGAALRLIQSANQPNYVLLDGTLSLPLVGKRNESLFYEHLKRLCCVYARERNIALLALSKSHGLPAIEIIESLARDKSDNGSGRVAEHWYLRLPSSTEDDWTLSLAEGRRLPPPGTVTYLVRFHHNTPVMRLDMDRVFWNERVRGTTDSNMHANEQRLFSDLDYAAHDQRSYGYPYPIKAAHDRASLTRPERIALRKQIVDAAVQAGMKRALFRDAAIATGHG